MRKEGTNYRVLADYLDDKIRPATLAGFQQKYGKNVKVWTNDRLYKYNMKRDREGKPYAL
jgi:hypothetical protein